ncbi:MAG: hypothetical protein L3J84_11005, partial [Gammaproteobacteria bacterium]|nr:hypothetical protein [Gammaproteobacteria bacterium]
MRKSSISLLLAFSMMTLCAWASGATFKGEVAGRYDYYAKNSLFSEQADRQGQYSLATALDYN